MSTRKTPAVTVDAVIEGPKGLLLVKRGKDPFKGGWALPGGFIECGESAPHAVVREVREETGLELKIKGLLGVYSDPGRDPRGHVISICYFGEGIGKPQGGDDVLEARYFTSKEVSEMELAFDHNIIIKDYMVKRDVLREMR